MDNESDLDDDSPKETDKYTVVLLCKDLMIFFNRIMSTSFVSDQCYTKAFLILIENNHEWREK